MHVCGCARAGVCMQGMHMHTGVSMRTRACTSASACLRVHVSVCDELRRLAGKLQIHVLQGRSALWGQEICACVCACVCACAYACERARL